MTKHFNVDAKPNTGGMLIEHDIAVGAEEEFSFSTYDFDYDTDALAQAFKTAGGMYSLEVKMIGYDVFDDKIETPGRLTKVVNDMPVRADRIEMSRDARYTAPAIASEGESG